MPSKRPLKLVVAALALVFGFPTMPVPLFAAGRQKVLHSFAPDPDASSPIGGLIFDKTGNLYGASYWGGKYECGYGSGCGTVFQLSPIGNGEWTETVLHSFSGWDGCFPGGSVVLDGAGNLYGTTTGDDSYAGCGSGKVFELLPSGNGKWTRKLVYRFPGGGDGDIPYGSLTFDRAGNLYGIASGGANGTGIVFELMHRAKGTWKEKVLYTFNQFKGESGYYPVGGVVFDESGSLYGMTESGGTSGCLRGCGTVFRLAPKLRGKWTYEVIHRFRNNAEDGWGPSTSLIVDSTGTLYGTTANGGTYGGDCFGGYGCGTVFELRQVNGKWAEKVLYSFIYDGKDGIYPEGSLSLDGAGNLYGTTGYGGSYSSTCHGGCGTVFKLAHGSDGKWSEEVLYRFNENLIDGDYPRAGVVLDPAGNLYGITESGGYFGDSCGFYGNGSCGIVFEIAP